MDIKGLIVISHKLGIGILEAIRGEFLIQIQAGKVLLLLMLGWVFVFDCSKHPRYLYWFLLVLGDVGQRS